MVDNQKAFAAFDSFGKAARRLIEELERAGVVTYEQALVAATEYVSVRNECPLVKSDHHRALTPRILDARHENYENARRALTRLFDVLRHARKTQEKGENAVSHRSAPKAAVRVPREIAALAAQLVAACAEYEGERKLAAQAVAEAWARVK